MTEAEYQAKLQEWKDTQPPKTQKVGNSMTQHYYYQEILPQHIDWIQKQKEAGMAAILMEDGDPSHGHKSMDNLSAQARRKALVQLHNHPAQSPDLNPIEGVRLLLEERLKQVYRVQLYQMDYWQLRKAIEACWALITQDEIRERISDMPRRCRYLIQHGGNRVKGNKW